MGLTAEGMEEMRAPTLRLGGSPARMEDVDADLLALEDWCERAAIADASGKSQGLEPVIEFGAPGADGLELVVELGAATADGLGPAVECAASADGLGPVVELDAAAAVGLSRRVEESPGPEPVLEFGDSLQPVVERAATADVLERVEESHGSEPVMESCAPGADGLQPMVERAATAVLPARRLIRKASPPTNSNNNSNNSSGNNNCTLDRWIVKVPLETASKTEVESEMEKVQSGPQTSTKNFRAELEDELKTTLKDLGFEYKAFIFDIPDKIPHWGEVVLDGLTVRIEKLNAPPLTKAPGLDLELQPEPVPASRKRPLPQSGLITKPVKVQRFGTIRRYSATHQAASALGVRNFRELSNCMFFSDVYQQDMEKANRPRCIHVNPQMAEYVMGYPVDWTSRSTSPTTATIPEHPTACFTGGSLFAGVGGLDLGLQKAVVTKMYCEIDPAATDVLQRRMDNGFLHRGEIHPDVCHIPKEALSGIEFLFGGFPCPDIAISGAKAGFGGVRSALFAHLIIAAARGDPVIMFLENVANILAADMVGVFTEVLRWLLMTNFTKI